jgi:hypothetical protein
MNDATGYFFQRQKQCIPSSLKNCWACSKISKPIISGAFDNDMHAIVFRSMRHVTPRLLPVDGGRSDSDMSGTMITTDDRHCDPGSVHSSVRQRISDLSSGRLSSHSHGLLNSSKASSNSAKEKILSEQRLLRKYRRANNTVDVNYLDSIELNFSLRRELLYYITEGIKIAVLRAEEEYHDLLNDGAAVEIRRSLTSLDYEASEHQNDTIQGAVSFLKLANRALDLKAIEEALQIAKPFVDTNEMLPINTDQNEDECLGQRLPRMAARGTSAPVVSLVEILKSLYKKGRYVFDI